MIETIKKFVLYIKRSAFPLWAFLKIVRSIIFDRTQKSAVILAYHRIANETEDPDRLCVSPKNFKKQIGYLKMLGYSFYTMSEFLSENEKSDKKKIVAITFDDGYADNFYEALPILEKLNTPATIFVATGKIDDPNPFPWNQKIEPSKYNRSLTTKELVELSKNPLIEIGAHSVNHQHLSSLQPNEQKKEILESKNFLERLTGKKIAGFAYPFGDFKKTNGEIEKIISDIGFKYACSMKSGAILEKVSLFSLPRMLVRDWDMQTFVFKFNDFLKNGLKLSIIMPCFNCSETLEEAVNSIYTQNLKNFEVVMVDDGSTDRTRKIMEKLAMEHKEIKTLFHEKNKGGGATRNTAIHNSTGDLIFSLDGDDILPPKMLPRLIRTIIEEKTDGAMFETSKFFKKDIKSIKNMKVLNGEKIATFENLFEKNQGSSTMVNFMYTRQAFDIAGNYPEHHGFDTQAFGISFLGKNLKAVISPGSYYYHRHGTPSYFMREYNAGNYSKNFLLALEPIMNRFSEETKKNIMGYDVKNNNLGNNLRTFLVDLYKKNPENFFQKYDNR